MNPEDLLRDTLRARAEDASIVLTLDDIRASAAERRRRIGIRVAVALAAAVVLAAIIVPTALMRSGDGSPSPAPSPTSKPSSSATAPSPSAPPSPAASSVLTRIGRGPAIGITWMSKGVIHGSDGDVRLPSGHWDGFTNYHGGWLLSGDNGLVQLDGNGGTSPVSALGSRIAVSGDGMETAFVVDGTVRIGITTGMGEGENVIPVRSPDESGPIGFLSSERVVYNGLKGQVLVLDPMDDSSTVLSGLARATASTQAGDLLAGTTVDDDGTAAVVSATNGMLWTKPHWVTGQFSPDGRYLAAYRTATGGEFETVAVLDARTGEQVAGTNLRVPALPETPTAWDRDGSLLIPYRDGQTWAVLRLETDGRMTRATAVFEGSPADDDLVFSARP